MAQVRIEHVFKRFGPVTAVNDFNLTVEDGEFVSILGPSGCGKTTSLRMIAGFEKATEGEIYIGDHCVSSSSQNKFVPPENRDIGMVFQSYAVWPHMTVVENVAYPLKIQKVPKEERLKRVNEMLELVHLGEYGHRYPHQLSGGQQQRVAFARAIVIEPACILFDEPLSALDALLREEMRSELRTLITKLGITGVFVTHDQIEAMSMSDAIAVCHAGKIEQYDTPEKIYSHPATEFVARFVGSSNWLDQNHLFRPEQAQTVPTEQAEKYDADVTAVQFLGSSYQLQLNHNGQDWTYISPRRVSVGEKISLYLPRSAIVAV